MKFITSLLPLFFIFSALPPYISDYHYDSQFGGWLKIALSEQKSKKECGSINISNDKMNFTFSCNGKTSKGLVKLEKIKFTYSNNILSAQNKNTKKTIFSIYCLPEQFQDIKLYISNNITI